MLQLSQAAGGTTLMMDNSKFMIKVNVQYQTGQNHETAMDVYTTTENNILSGTHTAGRHVFRYLCLQVFFPADFCHENYECSFSNIPCHQLFNHFHRYEIKPMFLCDFHTSTKAPIHNSFAFKNSLKINIVIYSAIYFLRNSGSRVVFPIFWFSFSLHRHHIIHLWDIVNAIAIIKKLCSFSHIWLAASSG